MKIWVDYAAIPLPQILDGLERATRISRTDEAAHEFCEFDADRLEQYAKRIRILLATKDKPVKAKKK